MNERENQRGKVGKDFKGEEPTLKLAGFHKNIYVYFVWQIHLSSALLAIVIVY